MLISETAIVTSLGGQQYPMLLPRHQFFADKRVENKDSTPLRQTEENMDSSPLQTKVEKRDSSPLQQKWETSSAVLCNHIAEKKDRSPLQAKSGNKDSNPM